MAGLSDILSAALNLVTVTSGNGQIAINLEGAQNSKSLSAKTQVKNSAGWVARVSVTTAGSTVGLIYDTTNFTTPSNPIASIPNVVGIYIIKLPANYGIVAVPGTGQVFTVSYS